MGGLHFPRLRQGRVTLWCSQLTPWHLAVRPALPYAMRWGTGTSVSGRGAGVDVAPLPGRLAASVAATSPPRLPRRRRRRASGHRQSSWMRTPPLASKRAPLLLRLGHRCLWAKCCLGRKADVAQPCSATLAGLSASPSPPTPGPRRNPQPTPQRSPPAHSGTRAQADKQVTNASMV